MFIHPIIESDLVPKATLLADTHTQSMDRGLPGLSIVIEQLRSLLHPKALKVSKVGQKLSKLHPTHTNSHKQALEHIITLSGANMCYNPFGLLQLLHEHNYFSVVKIVIIKGQLRQS